MAAVVRNTSYGRSTVDRLQRAVLCHLHRAHARDGPNITMPARYALASSQRIALFPIKM